MLQESKNQTSNGINWEENHTQTNDNLIFEYDTRALNNCIKDQQFEFDKPNHGLSLTMEKILDKNEFEISIN